MGTRPANQPSAAPRRGASALNPARAALAALALIGLLQAPALRAQEPESEPLAHFPRTEISIEGHGTTQQFRMYVAATEARRNQGLMFVKSLKPHEGMLFVFRAPQITSFWMKNCVMALDMLFVGADGRIIHVVESAAPGSLATINSMGPAAAVLEFEGGTSARLGLKPGDRVHYPSQAAE